jgi:hypothetical protein
VTARLYCRDCGWHPTYRRKKAALRAARRHRCLPPLSGSIPTSGTRPTSTPTDTSLTDCGSTESDDPEAEMPDSFTPSDHDRHGDHRAGSDHADRSAAWPRRLLAAVAGHPEPADPAQHAAASGSPAGARLRVAVLAAYHVETAQRARATITALVQAGYHVGPVPFGYRARHTEPESVGHRRHSRVRLTIEPVEAATVAMIFTWRVTDGLSRAEIVHRLAGARYPAPLHLVTARPVTWSPAIVATILRNPTYTGRTVWGRRHAGRPVAPTRWVTSAAGAHLAVVDDATFLAAQPSEPLRTELAIAWRSHQPQRADDRDSVRTDGDPSRAA